MLLVVRILWSEEWPKVELYTSEQLLISVWLVRGLKEAPLEDEGRGMLMDPQGEGTKCEDVCVLHQCLLGNIHLRGSTQQAGGQDGSSDRCQLASALGCSRAGAVDPGME